MLLSRLERSVNVTPDEADYVLARMSVVWSSKMLNVEEVRFWVGKLCDYEFDICMDALQKIEDTCKFWPSWAEFKSSIKAVQNSRVPFVGELQQPEEQTTPPERVREIIADIKANSLGKV